MSKRLENQIAWISGAASGMGEGVARLFAEEGAAVGLADVQAGKGKAIAESIRSTGGRAIFTECDVTREDQVRASIDRTAQEFGGVQILVNCAGIVQVKLLHELTQQDWDQLMNVNVRSIFFSVKHGIAHLRKNQRSYVVNIGSVGSYISQASTPAYIASKGAVLQLTRSIALDYAADGMRCNCVCPGITDTPMLREHLNKTPDPDKALAQRLRRVPMGVPLSPHDIAKSVLYFSCEDSAGVTGTSLIIDGGYLAAAEWETTTTKFMQPQS